MTTEAEDLTCSRCRRHTPYGRGVQYDAAASLSGREERLCRPCNQASCDEKDRKSANS